MEQLNQCFDVDGPRRKPDSYHKREQTPTPPSEMSSLWQDLEFFAAHTHIAWLVLIGVLLVLLVFVVAGFLLATAVLLVTFYLFICEQQHIETLEYS